ncbi:MAG: LapA family protein [Gammaproteobacteria bacterium]
MPMKILSWLTLVALVLLCFFAVANWSLLTTSASLNLLAFRVDGPLGLILLGATLVLVALFAIYALAVRTSALVESRRSARDLEAQRELADRAEASRFTELGSRLQEETAGLRAAVEAVRVDLLMRVDTTEKTVLAKLEENANSVAAHVGQVDDKLNRLTPR